MFEHNIWSFSQVSAGLTLSQLSPKFLIIYITHTVAGLALFKSFRQYVSYSTTSQAQTQLRMTGMHTGDRKRERERAEHKQKRIRNRPIDTDKGKYPEPRTSCSDGHRP
jgi:hypothetical protein